MLLKSKCALINTASLITSALTTKISSGASHLLFFPHNYKSRPLTTESHKETVQSALQKIYQQLLLFY